MGTLGSRPTQKLLKELAAQRAVTVTKDALRGRRPRRGEVYSSCSDSRAVGLYTFWAGRKQAPSFPLLSGDCNAGVSAFIENLTQKFKVCPHQEPAADRWAAGVLPSRGEPGTPLCSDPPAFPPTGLLAP